MLRTTLAALACGAARAADFEIKALNVCEAGMMVMEPRLLCLASDDPAHFTVTDNGHGFESIRGMLPEGATPIACALNQSLTAIFGRPGVYGLRCKPHCAMGTVTLVVVGGAGNIDAARAVAQPGKVRTVFAKLFEQLDTQKTASQ